MKTLKYRNKERKEAKKWKIQHKMDNANSRVISLLIKYVRRNARVAVVECRMWDDDSSEQMWWIFSHFSFIRFYFWKNIFCLRKNKRFFIATTNDHIWCVTRKRVAKKQWNAIENEFWYFRERKKNLAKNKSKITHYCGIDYTHMQMKRHLISRAQDLLPNILFVPWR